MYRYTSVAIHILQYGRGVENRLGVTYRRYVDVRRSGNDWSIATRRFASRFFHLTFILVFLPSHPSNVDVSGCFFYMPPRIRFTLRRKRRRMQIASEYLGSPTESVFTALFPIPASLSLFVPTSRFPRVDLVFYCNVSEWWVRIFIPSWSLSRPPRYKFSYSCNAYPTSWKNFGGSARTRNKTETPWETMRIANKGLVEPRLWIMSSRSHKKTGLGNSNDVICLRCFPTLPSDYTAKKTSRRNGTRSKSEKFFGVIEKRKDE